MAVTPDAKDRSDAKGRSDTKGRAKRKKTARAPARPPKRRDPFAAALADARYRKRVVKAAKHYSRKAKPEEEDVDYVESE
jgi:hypothetical protein